MAYFNWNVSKKLIFFCHPPLVLNGGGGPDPPPPCGNPDVYPCRNNECRLSHVRHDVCLQVYMLSHLWPYVCYEVSFCSCCPLKE